MWKVVGVRICKLAVKSLGREEELNSFITDLEEQHSKLRTLRIGRLGRGWGERVALSCQAGPSRC